MKFILLILLLANFTAASKLTQFITFGPRISINYGNDCNVSFGFETSYWIYEMYDYGSGYGVSSNFGIEYYWGGRTDLYSELQAGVGLAGLSIGAFNTIIGDSPGWGYQSTIWGMYFVGGDYRIKYKNEVEHQVGIIGRGLINLD